jgi:lysophospholipase L1-like esterase
MKIIFLGDSLTWGGYGGDFVAEIQQQRPNDTIINAGEGGNTVINLLRRVDDVLDQAPDGVFVMVGGNDAMSYTYPATRPYYRKSQQITDGIVTPEQFAQTYRELLLRIQTHHALAWVGLPPAEYSPKIVDAMTEYNTRAEQVAGKLNVPTLDFMAHFPPR